jgi:hypothetical protein
MTGHLDGQTGESEGRARVEFVRTLVGIIFDIIHLSLSTKHYLHLCCVDMQ